MELIQMRVRTEANSPFGEWLSSKLRTRDMNQRRLAEATGVQPSVVSRWFRKSVPSAASCDLIAEALHIPLEEVLEAAGYPIGRPSEPIGDLRAEAVRLIEFIPEPLLLPYVIGMRAMVSHRQPSLLMEELKASIAEQEEGNPQ